MTSHLLRLWVIGSYEMPCCDWLQHCNFLAGIEILPIALQTACKPYGFAAWRPVIVAGPVLRVAIGESCSVCQALNHPSRGYILITLLFILCLQQEKLLIFEFSKQNLAIFCSFFTGMAFGVDKFHKSHQDVMS